MALYKIRKPDGSFDFSDKPPAAGEGTVVELNGRPVSAPPPARPQREKDTDKAKELIGDARKFIPKTADYLNYLEYLQRTGDTVRLNKVMTEMQKSDPKLWLKLQKYPEFRPLAKTLGLLPAGGNILGAAAGVAGGSPGAAAQKYFEASLKDMMKRDRFYADVLGSKAPMVAPPQIKYSSPGLTAFMDVQGPKTAKALEGSGKALSEARQGVTEAHATAGGRVGGSIMDFEMWLLQPKTAEEIGADVVAAKHEKLQRAAVLDEDQELAFNKLFNAGRYKDALQFLDKAMSDFTMGRKP